MFSCLCVLFFYIINVLISFLNVRKLVIDVTILYIFQGIVIIFVGFINMLIFYMLLSCMCDFSYIFH